MCHTVHVLITVTEVQITLSGILRILDVLEVLLGFLSHWIPETVKGVRFLGGTSLFSDQLHRILPVPSEVVSHFELNTKVHPKLIVPYPRFPRHLLHSSSLSSPFLSLVKGLLT